MHNDTSVYMILGICLSLLFEFVSSDVFAYTSSYVLHRTDVIATEMYNLSFVSLSTKWLQSLV